MEFRYQLQKGISIIVPALNEAGNLHDLVVRLYSSLLPTNVPFEIIIIDDHSTDDTFTIASYLHQRYPVRVLRNTGQPGKAQSLLLGFAAARYETLGMIDADLEYPPEAFFAMWQALEEGSGVVVGKRMYKHMSKSRELRSRVFRQVFGQKLHKLPVDIQSGIKLFKAEILQRVTLTPSPWTFDLDFLIAARDSGYQLTEVPISVSTRHYGESKIKPTKASWEIGKAAVKAKFKGAAPIPMTEVAEVGAKGGFHYKQRLFQPFNQLHHSDTALKRVTQPQLLILVGLVLTVLLGLIVNWKLTVISLIGVITTYYFLDLLFSFYLIFRSFAKTPEFRYSVPLIESLSQRTEWPGYTIFCPLYKEAAVLPQFVTAMQALDYPKDKLQILLLLEEDDTETISAARMLQLPFQFEIIEVPHSMPKTKPKACNYGLHFARGEFSVIYDAEDKPDPLQLKKAVIAFEKGSRKLICVQAKLNFYNPTQNILTRVFTAEYSLWFDLVLSGLQSLHGMIPLGGTSNHFQTQALQEIGGWDAFNVTEDCDLGVRLALQGFETGIIDSVTLEEANSQYLNWFSQRTRWIKGYIQTYFVHMRSPQKFTGQHSTLNLILLQLVVGGKVAATFINPLMWVITILYFALRPLIGPTIESFYPAPILVMGVVSLVFGNFMYLYSYMIGCARHGHWDLLKYAYLVPLYWLFMSAASWKALYQFMVNPHYWAKTKHGLHLTKSSEIASNLEAPAV